MKHANIINIPKNPKKLLDYAMSKSFDYWIDEKSSIDNPSVHYRANSNLTFDEAFNIIFNNKPHWTIIFRNMSYINISEEDYWEFGGCNIGANSYGEVFIWIKVKVNIAYEIFEKFNLQIKYIN